MVHVELSGPITGGTRGGAFGRPMVDLAERGYRLDELVMSGTAVRYRHAGGGAPSEDGSWTAEAVEGSDQPYRTRVIVYRPADPAAFNGTAIVCWNNVTAGYDLFGGDAPEILEGGYAFVGVTVQKVGIDGLPPTPMGLAAWDAERYGSLFHPGDDHSFDIFTQAAAGARQLDGLDVRNVVAMGGSQSASRLATYVNAIQPLTNAFDGFLLTIYFGNASALEVGDTVVDINRVPTQSAAAVLRGTNRLRDDLGVPVFVVNSELEAISCLPVRQPDTDTFRYWEVAATSHVSVQSMAVRTPRFLRDFGTELPVTEGINRVSMLPIYDAALHHLRAWVADGTPPPSQPKIEFSEDGEI
ncbi:MAG TPA: alpha/beta hydrolase domain-containing protein, partial [Acidimicrobiales bacterium]|nr:alpha/beta hydrolase domain-containing protein [Acidimicrobiales bacterium]